MPEGSPSPHIDFLFALLEQKKAIKAPKLDARFSEKVESYSSSTSMSSYAAEKGRTMEAHHPFC